MTTPESLNHYRVLGQIGKGGMGEVFVAEDTRLHRRVALKLLPRAVASDPERRSRFEREAQAVAAINHPGIVTIHSVEEADGIPFLTMELVEGRTLGEISGPDGVPLETLLRIGISVSDAIAAAHQRGITHRDLKPANVLVTGDGRVKVLDFGLAKLREAQIEANGDDPTRMPSSDLTGEGRILGTVAYMSPEQAEGKPVDPRSDIFSLGVMLHEMATGRRPFTGDTNVSVISSILKDTPTPVTDINPALPAGLARVIRRALSKDPSRRYQTATDLRNDLEEIEQEINSGIRSSTAAGKAGSRGRGWSRRSVLVALALLALVSSVAAGIWLFQGGSASGSQIELDRLSRLTTGGNASLAALSPDGRYVAHVKADIGMTSLWVRQTVTTSDVQIVAPAPVRYDGVTYAPDGNHVYYVTYELTGGVGTLYRVPTLGGAPQRIVEDVDSRISFAPDGRRFAFVRGFPGEGTAWMMVAAADGTDVRRLSRLEPPDQLTLQGPSWSPDGRTIVAPAQALRGGAQAFLAAIEVESGTASAIPGTWTSTGDVEWLPDGRSLVVVGAEFDPQNNQLWQVTYPAGERRRLTNDLNNYTSVSLTADATALATVQSESTSTLWLAPVTDIAKGTQLTRGAGRRDGQQGIAWTPDGRIVFGGSASGRPQLWIVNRDGSDLRQLTSAEPPALSPSVTPDGRFIVFHRFDGGEISVWRMAVDGSDQRQLTRGPSQVNPRAGPDNQVYFTDVSSGIPRPFKTSIDGGESVQLADSNFRVVEVSADGREILGVAWDTEERRSTAAVMPAAGGTVERLRDVFVLGLAWAPGGRAVTFGLPAQDGLELYRYDLQTKQRTALGRIHESVFAYAWSPDGDQVALARGQLLSDVVLISLRTGGQ